jgi:DNA-directed RNA polymerase subunit RPC12/RpoP
MTRQQLLDNLDVVQKAQRRFVIMVVWAGLIFSCFALVFVKAFRSRIVVVEVAAVLLFAAVVADLLRLLRQRAKLGLVCPKCRNVFGEEKFQAVLTTGKCHNCGHKILDD